MCIHIYINKNIMRNPVIMLAHFLKNIRVGKTSYFTTKINPEKLFLSGRGINKFQKFNGYYRNPKVHPVQIFTNKENQEYKMVIKITHLLLELQKG